ncbi:unnamed protein product [Durusdinium trenchii]|uniref:Pentatricopeptide repeat-containing protein, chloroplastic n=3 Tax=Durusdinium trenchii TaxID=1381693 RepID=A0ABP0L251_9DINO
MLPLRLERCDNPLSAIEALKSVRPELGLQALDAIRGGRLEVNIYHCNTVISVTGKGKLWQDASLLLGMLSVWELRPTTSSFNAAISARVEMDKGWSRSISILQKMQQVRVEADAITGNSVASACRDERGWPLSLALAARDLVGFGTMMAACEVGSYWQLAMQCLRTLPRSVPVNRILYNAVISACASCGEWQQALFLLRNMLSLRIRADVADFNASMGATSNGSQWAFSLSIKEELLHRRLKLSLVTVNICIGAAEHSQSWELTLLAQDMLRSQLLPSTVTWVALVTATTHDWRRSLSVLESMCQEVICCSYVPFRAAMVASWSCALGLMSRLPQANASTVTCNAVMSACRGEGKWQEVALTFFHIRRSAFEPNAISYLTAISACESAPPLSDQWETALRLLFAMPAQRLPITASPCNSAISACEKAGQWQLAVFLLWSMPHNRIPVDEISFNAGISACSKGSEWELALVLLSSMPAVATTVTYNAAITACEKAGAWEIALALLLSSPATDPVSWSATISACEKAGRWRHALQLLTAMKDSQVTPNAITFNASISACEKGREWPGSLSMLGAMPEAGTDQDQISFSAAVSACEKTGEWRHVLQVVASMRVLAICLNRIIYNAAIGASEKGLIPASFEGFHRCRESSDLIQ